LRGSHLRQGKAFLICYSIVDPASFNEAKDLFNAITNMNDGPGKVACVVVGCKNVRTTLGRVRGVLADAHAMNLPVPLARSCTGLGAEPRGAGEPA